MLSTGAAKEREDSWTKAARKSIGECMISGTNHT
jgi:hypothetical protein